MADVTLTWFEMQYAASVGVARRLSAITRDRPQPYGTPAEYWGTDIEGAIGELALAKHLNVYWEPVLKNPKEANGDVDGQQVRATTRANGCLIIHPQDSDDAPFWLALTHQKPVVTILGPCLGRYGKQQQWWRTDTGRPAYFVPQTALA